MKQVSSEAFTKSNSKRSNVTLARHFAGTARLYKYYYIRQKQIKWKTGGQSSTGTLLRLEYVLLLPISLFL